EFPRLRHYFLIWTTTPWTLPANLAIALHPDIMYHELKVDMGTHEEVWVFANDLLDSCIEKFNIDLSKVTNIGGHLGKDLEGITYQHPFIDRSSKVILGDYVTTESGTGCVHIAPGHGQDDYELGLKYGLETYAPVDDRGAFTEDVEEFAGIKVFEANPLIIERLRKKDALLKEEKVAHSYPHCWRCKKPVIFRATEQWFISMNNKGLRETALKEIDAVKWIPHWGRDRIYNMILNRPDWCLSRQRAWGVPIPVFYCKKCNHAVINDKLIDSVAERFEGSGADDWFAREAKEFLPEGFKCPKCGGDDFSKEEDILDVWFDSGISFAAVLEKDEELSVPADLYLEGSDQHRGWFHSSLLTSVGTRGNAPYKEVLTHGFVVDGDGKKMSKSLGNVISPQKIIKRYGAEILRLWVAAEDYREDIRLSEEILKRLVEAYRRIRNTCRFLLGNLSDFDPSKDMVVYSDLGEMDKWALHRLSRLTERILTAYKDYEFHTIYHSLYNFCIVDLSNFYLDVLKDCLYTFKRDSKGRRAVQTVLYHLLDHITRLIAPILSFTADEVWKFTPKNADDADSVHLLSFPEARKEWIDEELYGRWNNLLKIRGEVAKALETARRDKVIGSSLEAKVSILAPDDLRELMLKYLPKLKSIFIVSSVSLVKDTIETSGNTVEMESRGIEGLKIWVNLAEGKKCERCWNYSLKVGDDPLHPLLCERCVEVIV
ncbi:MAG: isoleucine--tRNA ligase, partial [Thermodesulfobacteriota bacterium]